MRRRSWVRSGCGSVEHFDWRVVRASSSWRMRSLICIIFSWSCSVFARMNLAGDERGGVRWVWTDLLPFPEVSAPVRTCERGERVGRVYRPSGHISAHPRFEQDWQGNTRSHCKGVNTSRRRERGEDLEFESTVVVSSRVKKERWYSPTTFCTREGLFL